MRVRVLGSLEVLGPEGWDTPSAAKRRQVLAVLALTPGEAVAAERIADAIWGDVVPDSAMKIVQNHVLALRQAYGPELVITRPGGYALGFGDEATDARAFEAHAREGSAALERGELGDALRALDEASAIWRGRPFPDLEGWAPAAVETIRLEELHHGAVENHLDAKVSSGSHLDAIADLQAGVAAEPLRERRWELLMVALARSGRQAEALRAYQRARSSFVDELGIEPGPVLRELDRSIAMQDDETSPRPAELQPRHALAIARKGAAQRLAGDESYRITLHEAARLAADTGDADALVAAAVGGARRAGARSSGSIDEELVDLLKTAVARTEDDSARAQLLSVLGQELAASPDHGRPRSMSDQALDAARRTGDAAIISEVLARRSIALAGPDLVDERRAATEENLRIAPHVGDPLSWWTALFTRIAVAVEVGDIVEVERRLGELRNASDDLNAPPGHWGLLITEAWHHLLRGRVDAAERTALEGYQYGTAHAQPDALAVYAGQLLNVRRSQGRLLELESTLLAALDQPPANPSTRPILAEAVADIGHHGHARSMLREELEASVATASGQYWLTVACAWATVATRVDDTEAAEHLRDLLAPHTELVCFNGAFVVGSVGHFHGMLSTALGDRHGAEVMLDSALRTHKQLDAPLLVARTEAMVAKARS